MGCVDQTAAFRAQVRELAHSYPPSARSRRDKSRSQLIGHEPDATNDGFLTEAYAILKHIITLSDLLSNIRRPYLNVDAQPPARTSHSLDLNSSSSIRTLTNEERDQIDLHARVILSQCADRVSKLEQLEKIRSTKVTSRANPFRKFLPSLIPATTSLVHSELIASHRSNVTWYLTRRLADVSATQKEMQEERVRRQLDRARSLGGSSGLGKNNNASSATTYGSFGSSSFEFVPPPVIATPDATLGLEDDEGSEADMELTEAQIQQFEAENAAILRQQEDLLASVKQAESRLLDISALQTELVVQLARQTEMVDTLYDEAIASQTEVEKGNEQLKKARERAKSSRKWILMFILFATFCLLFLHSYD